MGNFGERQWGISVSATRLAYIPVAASAGALVGGVLLAVAAVRSGTLGALRALLLLSWAWTFIGVLKESDGGTIIGAVG